MNVGIELLAGTFSGATQTIAGHAFDTIKVRMQTGAGAVPGTPNTTWGAIKMTIAQDGFLGFFKGIGSPLVGAGAVNAVRFLASTKARNFLGITAETQDLPSFILAAYFTGFCISFVDTPIDILKIKLQTQVGTTAGAAGEPLYKNIFDCGRHILRTYGWRGLTQGLGATMFRNIPGNGVYFGGYEWSRMMFLKWHQRREEQGRSQGPAVGASASDGSGWVGGGEEGLLTHRTVKDLSSWEVLVSGGIAGIACWLYMFPADVVKTAMQGDHSDPAKRKYKGIMDCFVKLWEEGGLRRFYRGMPVALIRAFPANAACFWGYEWSRSLIVGSEDE